ncbi:MAG: glycine zipper 2TM domain-containing protein [Tepidiphilus sp.]|jgi:outer membrane lipoprotein SlyB|uniref:Glycine zipper 2TM domain-containing protein n=1 Tax=Tepidiphilus baoligensis TaxID=2698687 RepID=A0ABX1QKD6_9PROT|nr:MULTISPECIES: glycine zipper 2TM domain-containing protein [Tepidiphilus]MDD2408933.1 glycine zipper 2TM domain-containing protein [Tepidiphilus sp.]MDD3434187.1 glycine zipper 2TM domain-containing protein [Tepidiphilus sp.]NMH16402.1 glycine zipper 2TM domain-containing protein [Tepidiphilus baoligensis]
MVVKKGMVLMVVAALGVAGCASGLGGGTYGRTEARRAMSVQYGVVESVRPVQLEGTKSPLGAGAGAVVGGVAGSGVGGGRGQIVGATVGAVAGGLAGAALEEVATRRPGVEVTVRLDNGRVIAVVQEDEGEGFRLGERVRVLSDGGTMRVAR